MKKRRNDVRRFCLYGVCHFGARNKEIRFFVSEVRFASEVCLATSEVLPDGKVVAGSLTGNDTRGPNCFAVEGATFRLLNLGLLFSWALPTPARN